MNGNPIGIGPQSTSSAWLDRLAMLVAEIRPDWQTGGVRSALLKVADRPLRDVALAALAATSRTDQHSPAVIALDGPHWRGVAADVVSPKEEPLCVHCRHTREGCAHAQAVVPPAQRFVHEFTTPREPRPTRLRPSERTPDALDDVGGPS